MHKADITAAIKKAGMTQAAIARKAGVHTQVVNAVVCSRGRSARLEALISQVTCLPLHQLWPRHYSADGAEPQPQSLEDQIQSINTRLSAIESRLSATVPNTHEVFALIAGAILNAIEARNPSTDRS